MFRRDGGITEQANHDAAVATFAGADGAPRHRTREARIPRTQSSAERAQPKRHAPVLHRTRRPQMTQEARASAPAACVRMASAVAERFNAASLRN